MKSKMPFLLLLLSAILFFSCQREIDILPDTTPNEGTVLWKYVEMDTTMPSGLDTVDVYFFEYDLQKRIVRLTNYYRDDTSSSPAYPYNSITEFFYTGNDTL